MINAALSSLLAMAVSSTADSVAPVDIALPQDPQGSEVEAEIRAAGDDVAALLELATRHEGGSRGAAARLVFERVIELDSDNERARKALQHQRYDGRWFESHVALARFKREEETGMKAKGLARFNDEWVPEADLPFLRMRWVRDAQQAWVHPADITGAREIEEWQAAGYQFRADDSSWIAPDDLEKWTALQWKCGDAWLDMAAANAFHANPAHPWELTGEHFRVRTTCEWDYGNAARWHADQTHAELVRLFGVAPKTMPSLLVLNGLEQYNAAAGGDMVDAEGLSSLHGAYFSEAALDRSQPPVRFGGTGVSFWSSSDPTVANWGPYWVRWAAAQSFVDAIDPSWQAVSAWVASNEASTSTTNATADLQAYGGGFWREKSLPRWFRYGAASYVESFLANPEVDEGEDRWNLRAFTLAQMKQNGGLRELSQVFTFRLTLADIPGSTRLYREAGLVVAFLLDGAPDDADLRAKHEALRSALTAGSRDEVRAAAKALEAALSERDEAIRAFGGL